MALSFLSGRHDVAVGRLPHCVYHLLNNVVQFSFGEAFG
jgi:hypothetical protein